MTEVAHGEATVQSRSFPPRRRDEKRAWSSTAVVAKAVLAQRREADRSARFVNLCFLRDGPDALWGAIDRNEQRAERLRATFHRGDAVSEVCEPAGIEGSFGNCDTHALDRGASSVGEVVGVDDECCGGECSTPVDFER